MTYPTLKSLSKPLGLLWVSCVLAAPACGKKEAPEAPPELEAPAEPTAETESATGDGADKGEPQGDTKPGDVGMGEGQADPGEGLGEAPIRKRPGDRVVRRPTRVEDSEGREIRPRLRPGPANPAGEPGAETGEPANPTPADPGGVASPPTPSNPANPAGEFGMPSLPTDPGNPPAAEVNPALAERPNPNNPMPLEAPGPTPEADRVLTVASVLEVLKGQKLSPAGPLPGIAVQPGYSSTHYAVSNGKTLGVTLQIWQDPARRESDDRYRRMRLQYPKAEDVSAMPPAKAFYSYFAGVQTLTFVDSVKRVVASVSCGEGVCNHEQLLSLARRVRDRL